MSPLPSSLATGVAALALAGFVVASPIAPARAGMKEQMEKMYDGLINPTSPGFYDAARRGEITGGGLYARTRIVDPNVFTLNPPSIRAGCGGIDIYTGSFSFINKDQFVQLGRAVASNAVGYSFSLALDAMCPQCMSKIETLMRKVQSLNEHFGNSCQLAKGIVNDTASAITGQKVGEASVISMAEGFGDALESFTLSDGESPTSTVNTTAPEIMEERLTGNLVWRALKRSGVDGWFRAGGDDEVLSVMMSLSGTVVVEYDDADDSFDVTTIPGNPAILESWIEGTPVDYYDCEGESEDGCRSPSLATSDWEDAGFAQAVFERLTDRTDGLITIARDGGGEPSPEVLAMIQKLPGTAGNMVRLSSISEAAAFTFAREAAYQIAIELTSQLLNDMRDTTMKAIGQVEDDAHVETAREVMNQSWSQNQAELSRLQRKHGKLSDLLSMYEDFFQVMRPAAETSVARVLAAAD